MQDMITDGRMCNLQMVKGDTLSFAVKIKEIGQDLSSAHFTVKSDRSTSTKTLQKTLNNGITKVSAEGNDRTYRVRVAPADTSNVAAGRYYYDFKIGVNGDIFTLLIGILDIEQNVGA